MIKEVQTNRYEKTVSYIPDSFHLNSAVLSLKAAEEIAAFFV